MSSSDEEKGPPVKSSRIIRRKKLSAAVHKNTNHNASTIYTSIGKKSMLYDTQRVLDGHLIAKHKTVDATTLCDNDSIISSKVLKIKDELGEFGIDVRALDEEEKLSLLNTVQCAASNLDCGYDCSSAVLDDNLSDCIPIECPEDSNRLDRLCEALKEDRPISHYKVIISFDKTTKPMNVCGKDTLQDVLARSGLNFTRQPRVFEASSSVYESNLIPVKFHKRTLEKLGFEELSVLRCVCLDDDEENQEPPPGIKKLIFRVGTLQNVEIFASPAQKFSELIAEFENKYNLKEFDKTSAKYQFDGELIKPEDTVETLEMENGDFVDVFLT